MNVAIIGAGMAGLLAGNMLRHRATVYERQSELPNNHSALLRFRTGVVGTALGIPFKKVRMTKAVFGDNTNPIANTMRYAKKVIGTYRTDRSLPIGVVQDERYIAPPDLIQQMAEPLKIEYGVDAGSEGRFAKVGRPEWPIISTMPMPDLIKILGYNKKIEFNYRTTYVVTATIVGCDAYATLYFPGSNYQAYRASITGDKLIIELPTDSDGDMPAEGYNDIYWESTAHYYAKAFGLNASDIRNIEFRVQRYGKIVPIDEDVRKDFMHWATDEYNIYSLGRFATWRPNLLLDDLVSDVNKISQWMLKGGKYGLRQHRG
jgi:hypothetical protein